MPSIQSPFDNPGVSAWIHVPTAHTLLHIWPQHVTGTLCARQLRQENRTNSKPADYAPAPAMDQYGRISYPQGLPSVPVSYAPNASQHHLWGPHIAQLPRTSSGHTSGQYRALLARGGDRGVTDQELEKLSLNLESLWRTTDRIARSMNQNGDSGFAFAGFRQVSWTNSLNPTMHSNSWTRSRRE